MRGLAHRRIVHLQVAADRADHHVAGIEPDANLHFEAMARPQLGREAADRLLHAQRRVAGAHGVILVGERRAEQRHDAVAHHQVHGALVVMHRLHHSIEHRLEDSARILGIALGNQLHRAFEVREQHRHLLALAFKRRARGENFFREMFWGVVLGRGKARLFPPEPCPACGGRKGWNRRKVGAAFGAEFCRGRICVPA
jgi:hypothetical protein